MTEDKPSECVSLKELDRILTSDQYYSEPEVLESIFNIPTPPLPDDVQQEILNACAEKGEPLPSLESLIPTNTTASGIISHLVNAGLPCSDNNQGVAFDHEAIRVFFLAHEIALPWQLFPSSPSNSKKRMSQLLGLREIQESLLEKANTRQRNNDEQKERELRQLQLEEARARAETGKAESFSIVSDGCINIYEDSDLRHEFLIRVAVLEKLSAELGLGFEKGDELEDALQQLGAIVDTVNKKPSKYRDDALKEEIKRYLDCWLSADNTTPEYAISQYRLSQWRAKYLGGQSGAAVEVQSVPIAVVQVKESINNPPADKVKKRKHTRGEVTQKQAAALCGVSLRLFQEWEAGENTPDKFPGRTKAMVFRAWAESYCSQARFREAAIGMNRAVVMDPADLEDMEDKGDTWD